MQSSWKYTLILNKRKIKPREHVKLKKNWIWDVLEIDWSNSQYNTK